KIYVLTYVRTAIAMTFLSYGQTSSRLGTVPHVTLAERSRNQIPCKSPFDSAQGTITNGMVGRFAF
ncbi:MAG: hypothetical protein AAGA75_27415, partial [Cyanobacteria bacterium P01_E01_bin.6]